MDLFRIVLPWEKVLNLQHTANFKEIAGPDSGCRNYYNTRAGRGMVVDTALK